jgi:hypothetical protein
VNSKHDEVNVRNTYANIDSLKAEFELKNARQQEGAKPTLSKKQQRQAKAQASANPNRFHKPARTSKPSLNHDNSNRGQERIVIDLDEENETDGKFTQYEIEYAPKKDVLKYGIDIYKPAKTNKETRKSRVPRSDNDDEFDVDQIDKSDDDSDSLEQNSSLVDERLEVSLEELINVHLVSMIEKQYVVIGEQSNSSQVEKSTDPKDRKVYVEKEEATGYNSKTDISLIK